LIARLRVGTAEFLIEVSFDTCYHLRINADHPCSHTEITGHNEGNGNTLNINTNNIINFAGAAKLIIDLINLEFKERILGVP